jgi:hypothetical protein
LAIVVSCLDLNVIICTHNGHIIFIIKLYSSINCTPSTTFTIILLIFIYFHLLILREFFFFLFLFSIPLIKLSKSLYFLVLNNGNFKHLFLSISRTICIVYKCINLFTFPFNLADNKNLARLGEIPIYP